MLIRHQVVMGRHERQVSDRHVYFQAGADDDESREGYYLHRDDYNDMGQPDQITVMVRPGDTLTLEDSLSKVTEENDHKYEEDGSEE